MFNCVALPSRLHFCMTVFYWYSTITVKPVLRGSQLVQKGPYKTGDLLKKVQFIYSVYMKFSMTGQEMGDLLKQVTA